MIIVCIKVGTKYGAEYVNKLERMVRRHTTVLHRFVCLTDNLNGLLCENFPIDTDLPGWWSKLILFKPHVELKNERILYIDLDTVIVKSIDPLLKYAGHFCIIKDWWTNGYNSSVMAIRPYYGRRIYNRFIKDAQHLMHAHHGDQDWITSQVNAPDIWQRIASGVIGSYKADNLEKSPRDFALVCFHGEPKPHQIEKGWVHDNWL